jgi:hypothetical protein
MSAIRIRRSFSFVCITALLAVSAPLVRAQSGANTGLQGRVTDATGASIPGVTVTIERSETGERRVVTSSDTGDWEARLLSPGQYQLTFEHTGFKKLVREGIAVSTSQMAGVDVQLEVGEVGQSIEVLAHAEMVSSTSATTVRTLDRRELEALPTSSRNFTQLLVIEPGVSADISELLSNDNASISPSVNGARTTNNSFVYNGVDVTNLLCCNSRINGDRGSIDQGGGSLSRSLAPAPETLEEVKLQTSLYDAATGRNGGGNFQLVSKSGTNEFHGTLYHYLQNDKFIANEFFYNRAGLERPMLRRNEGGGTIGGPIIKNKTFFFASYQATRARTSFVDEANNIIRLPQALTDDRSDTGINAFAQAIWSPTGGPFNASIINPISRELLKAKFEDGRYLIPSGAGGTDCRAIGAQLLPSCQVISVLPATFRQDQFSVNIDHQITSGNRISGKFFYTDQPSVDPLANAQSLSRFERNENTAQRTFSLTDVAILSPTVANEFRAGFMRNRNDTRAVPYFTNEQFGIISPLAGIRPDLATFDIRGDRDVGDRIRFGTLPGDTLDVQNSFTYGDTLSWVRSKHSLKFGGEFRRHQLNGNLQELKNGRKTIRSWFDFLTVGYANPGDRNRTRQLSDSTLNFGETIRGYRMSDASLFVADDWKVSSNLTLNIGVRWEYFGFPYEVNGILSAFDYPAAVAANDLHAGFIMASNFKPESVAGADQANLRKADSRGIIPGDYNNFMPRFGFAWSPFGGKKIVLRGGYGMFYERTTGGFANSLRQAAPFFREAQINDVGNYNTWPNDIPVFPIPAFRIGFDDGSPQVEAANNPGVEFEALETQMIDPNLATPYTQQWNLNIQWELKPSWLWEIGYSGTKGTKLLQILNANQAVDIDTVGFLPRAGVPGGGFFGNYYDTSEDDEFINLRTPPADCPLLTNPGQCRIAPELRGRLLGLDEDEGANTLYSNSNSIYNSLQTSLQKRFTRGYMFKLNYTFSRSLDLFSDEAQFQVEHDQSRPWLNRGLSDFHRKHRLIVSGSWDLPFRGNQLVRGWSISGIGTAQSGRPFSIIDSAASGFLFGSQNPRPDLAPGATHEDLVTDGPVSSRVDMYLNRDATVPSGARLGNLGRNVVIGPDQRRIDLVAAKQTRLRERTSLEFRAEFFNAFNTVTFRNPDRNRNNASFGQISKTRGGPRVIQFGLKLRF